MVRRYFLDPKQLPSGDVISNSPYKKRLFTDFVITPDKKLKIQKFQSDIKLKLC